MVLVLLAGSIHVSASPMPPMPEQWVMDADGTGQRSLGAPDYGFYGPASWAPDSRRLVVDGLKVVDVVDGDVTELTSGRGPDWSPVSEQIVFSDTTSHPEAYDEELYLISADGSGRRLLLDTEGLDASPVWSPDAGRIAFISERGGGGPSQIYVIDSDGTDLRQISTVGSLHSPPTWSPDGTRLAFRSADYDLYVAAVDGSGEVLVSDGGIGSPVWCPDGTLYHGASTSDGPTVFAYTEAGGSSFLTKGIPEDCSVTGRLVLTRKDDIHILDPGEEGTPNLTDTPQRSDLNARWSPDGERIAFTSVPQLPLPVAVERSLTLSLRGHVVARGTLTAEDPICLRLVKIQRLRDGGWKTVRKIQVESDGSFRVRMADRAGFFRAVAPHGYTEWGQAECLRAVSEPRRHRH